MRILCLIFAEIKYQNSPYVSDIWNKPEANPKKVMGLCHIDSSQNIVLFP